MGRYISKYSNQCFFRTKSVIGKISQVRLVLIVSNNLQEIFIRIITILVYILRLIKIIINRTRMFFVKFVIVFTLIVKIFVPRVIQSVIIGIFGSLLFSYSIKYISPPLLQLGDYYFPYMFSKNPLFGLVAKIDQPSIIVLETFSKKKKVLFFVMRVGKKLSMRTLNFTGNLTRYSFYLMLDLTLRTAYPAGFISVFTRRFFANPILRNAAQIGAVVAANNP